MKAFYIGLGVLAVLVMVCVGGKAIYAAVQPAPAPSAQPGGDDARLRASCANNLKQLGLVFKLFANENKGQLFPRLSSEPGRLMFSNESLGGGPVYPEYLTDLNILICPADSDAALSKDPAKKSDPKVMLDDHSYFYLGYAVASDADVKAFAEAYKERIKKGLKFDEDLTGPKGKIYAFREGLERFFITDINDPASAAKAQAQLPILIERPDNHTLAGGNVLFMDGHVEFIRYSEDGKWPMTKATIETLKELDALKPPAK